MTRYLLDTTALIDYSKGREPAYSLVLGLGASADDVGISVVNLAEFYAGIERGVVARLDQFLDALTLWDVTRAIALRAAVYRYQFARRGVTILLPDALIAATAAEHGAILLTGNVRDFPMTDIDVRHLI